MTRLTSWMKLLAVVGAALALPSLASAREGWRGWCEVGNQSVITSGVSSTTKVQRSFPECTVTVFNHGGGLATIYRDNNGNVKANPFQANLDGSWIFYADDGRYDIQTSGANFPTPFTYLDVLLCDPFVAGAVCAGGGGGGGAHNLLSTTHLDTIPFSPPVRGDIITAQNLISPAGTNPSWARLPLGSSGQVLSSNGVDAVWATLGSLDLPQTFATVASETATLPNSRQLIAGTNITFDVTTPGQLTINSPGSGGIGSPCDPTGLPVAQSTFCAGPVPDDGLFAVPYIQGNFATQIGSPPFTYSVNFLGPVTAGHKKVVMAACLSFPGLDCQSHGTVTGTQGDTYTFVGHSGAGHFGIDYYVATAAASGIESVSVTFGTGLASATQGSSITIGEYENLGTFQAVGGNTMATSGVLVTNIATGFNNEVVIGQGIAVSVGSTDFDLIIPNVNKNPTALFPYMANNFYAKTAGTYSVTTHANNITGLNGELSMALASFRMVTAPPPTSASPTFRVINIADLPFQVVPLIGRSTSLGGGALGAGACASQDVNVDNAIIGNSATTTPDTYPGDGFYWSAMVKQTGVVTIRICAATAGTPTASLYEVRVIP